MHLYENLIELLADARSKDRHIRFIDGDKIESIVTFAELWDRALALLGALQARGIKAGDELVIFSKSNESFVVAYWAAMLGGLLAGLLLGPTLFGRVMPNRFEAMFIGGIPQRHECDPSGIKNRLPLSDARRFRSPRS